MLLFQVHFRVMRSRRRGLQCGGEQGIPGPYDSSNASYIYVAWYRQRPGGPLQYLLQSKGRGGSYSHTAPFARKRFSCQADKSSGTLIITGLELGDSALYYCTLQGPQ